MTLWKSLLSAMLALAATWSSFLALETWAAQAKRNPAELFAELMNTGREDVTDVCEIALLGAPGIAGALIGTYPAGGTRYAAAVPLYRENDALKPGAAEKLMPGNAIRLVGVVDLKGPPRQIDLTERPCPGARSAMEVSQFAVPALLLEVVYRSVNTQHNLIMLTIEQFPRVVWRQVIHSVAANGAGYETVQMRLEEMAGDTLGIALVQHALPGRDEDPYMPGPPLTLRFQMVGESYRRMDE